MRNSILILLLLLSGLAGFAQQVIEEDPDPKRKPDSPQVAVPWAHIRQADAIYRKRIWRIIDVREKPNKVMTWPGNAFADILLRNARANKLPVYSGIDSMQNAMDMEQVAKATSTQITIDVIDSSLFDPTSPEFDPGEAGTTTQTVNELIRWEDVQQFRIMEEWIFDKNSGHMYTRIICIQPMVDIVVNGASIGQTEPMFTVKYPELRKLLVNEPIFNRQSDKRYSYDLFFEQRLFSSYIVKEPNVFDYAIKAMPEFEHDNLGALMEADRIKLDLFNAEHDMWEY